VLDHIRRSKGGNIPSATGAAAADETKATRVAIEVSFMLEDVLS
jgi:hypothetical protein